jgi:hypothetical protein
MAAKFEVYNDKVGGKFRLRLIKTTNGTALPGAIPLPDRVDTARQRA